MEDKVSSKTSVKQCSCHKETITAADILIQQVLSILYTLDPFFQQIIKLSEQINRWTQVWCNGNPSMRRMAVCEVELLIINIKRTIRMIHHELEHTRFYLVIIKKWTDITEEDKQYQLRVDEFEKCITKFEAAVNHFGVARDRTFRDQTRSVCIALDSMTPEEVDHLLRTRNPAPLGLKAVQRVKEQFDRWEQAVEKKQGKQLWIKQWRKQSQNFELWDQYKALHKEHKGMQTLSRTMRDMRQSLRKCKELRLDFWENEMKLETIPEEECKQEESPIAAVNEVDTNIGKMRRYLERERNRGLQVGTAAAVVLGVVGLGLGVLRR